MLLNQLNGLIFGRHFLNPNTKKYMIIKNLKYFKTKIQKQTKIYLIIFSHSNMKIAAHIANNVQFT